MPSDTPTTRALSDSIYLELHRIADGYMKRERTGHTLQPSDLVNEAIERLLQTEILAQVPDRHYLFAAAAKAMRRILVEHARKRQTQKRGGTSKRVTLDDVLDSFAEHDVNVLALDTALDKLNHLHERQAQIVELRFFGGYTNEEIAQRLHVSLGTVENDFRKARAFLHSQLVSETAHDSRTL